MDGRRTISRPLAPARAARHRALAAALALACAPLLEPGAARAQDVLEEIVVTADEPRTGDVVVEDHVGTRSSVDRETLERRDVTLDDIVAREAGVQRRRSGGFGSFASITVRAASPAQTSLLLDGVRLNSAGNAVIDLSTLELLALDAVDVYRGVTPLQFGTGAIGGAVNLRTPRVGDGPPVNRLGLGAASFGTARAEAAHVGRHGRWETVAALGATSADNDFPFVNANSTPLVTADNPRQKRNNADARRIGLLAKLGTRHGENARTDLLTQLGERRLGVPEWLNAEDNRAAFDTSTLQLQLSHARDRVAGWNTRHTLFLHAEDNHFDDRESQVGLGPQDATTRTRTLGVDTYWTRPLGPGTFDAKGELRRETLGGTDRRASAPGAEARRLAGLLGVRWSAYAFGGRVVIAPALRLQTNDDALDRSGTGERRTNDSRSFLPSIGVRLDVDDGLTLHASIARHEREPTFAELFVDRGLLRGNPDLVAERGTDADLGAEWSPAASLALAAALFASERDELIVTTFDARNVGRAINTGRARVLGLELSADWTPAPAWRLAGNATVQDARNLSANPTLDALQLPGEARVQGHAALHYRPSRRWRLRFEIDATRDRHYDQLNRRPARDSTITRIGIDHHRGRWHTAFAIDNLGDDNVEDFNGFPRPGRAFSLHVTLTL